MLDKVTVDKHTVSKIRILPAPPLSSHHVDNVVDLEDGADSLGGEGDGAGGHQQRLHHVLLQDVRDSALPHVDSGRLLSLRVPAYKTVTSC